MKALTDYFDKTLIPEWRQAWGYLTIKISTLCATLAAVWPLLPKDQQAQILGFFGFNGMGFLALAGFVSVIIARWKLQPSLPAKDVSSLKELRQYLSVRLSAIGALVAALWIALPGDEQQAMLSLLPQQVSANYVAVLGFLLVVWGRLKNQPDLVPIPVPTDDQK